MVRFLQSEGFSIARIRGSHHVMVRKEIRTTVPVHGGDALKIGTLRAIDMTATDFAQRWGQ